MHQQLRERRGEGGFTLIELLVVMIIIAILMAVAVPTFLAQKNNAQKSKATANIKQIVNAIESCAANNTNGTYDGCTTAAALTTFEKGLASLGTIGTTANVNTYAVVGDGTTNIQGYAVGTGIKDGDTSVYFAEIHKQNGELLKICGNSANIVSVSATKPSAGVSGSRTCTTGTWG